MFITCQVIRSLISACTSPITFFFFFFTGLDICLGKPLDDVIVRSLLEEVEALKEKLTTYKEKTGDLEGEKILQGLNLFKDEVSKDLKKLQADQAKIENSFQEIKKSIRDDLRAELRGLFEEENSRFLEEITNQMKEIKQTVAENSRRLEKLENIVRTLTDDFQSSFERLGNMRHFILRDDKDSQSNKRLAAATAELHEKSPDVHEQSQDLEKLDDVNQEKGEMKGKEEKNSRCTLGGVPDVQSSLDGSGNIRQHALKDGKNSQSNKQLAAATTDTAELHEKSPDVQEQSQNLEKLDGVNQWKGEMKGKEKENSRRFEVLEEMVGTLVNGVPDVQSSLDGSGNIRQHALKDGKNSQSNKQLAAATADTAELHEKSPDVHEQSQDLEKLDDVNQRKGEMKDEKAENSKRLEESRDKDKEFPATACAGELHARCQDLQRPRNNKKRQKRRAKKGSKK